MLTSITLGFFTVYLFKYPYGLLMALSYLIKRYILIRKLAYVYVVKTLAAAESVLLDILCVHTDLEIHKILAAIKCPASYRLYRIWNIYRCQRPAP